MAGHAHLRHGGLRQQPENDFTEFIPEMALLDSEMQKLALIKAACTARNTEYDKNVQTRHKKSTAIFRVAFSAGID